MMRRFALEKGKKGAVVVVVVVLTTDDEDCRKGPGAAVVV